MCVRTTLVAATPLTLWLRVLPHDDHPVRNLVAPGTRGRLQAIQLTSASLCLLREMLCANLHSVVSVPTVPHLSPLSSACSCSSTSCRSSSHCVSRLSESLTSVLSENVLRQKTLFRLVLQRVASSRHRGQLSVAVEAVENSTRSDLVLTNALLSCVPWSSRDCSDNSIGSHIFDSAWRLSSQRRISTAQQHQPICTPRHSSSLQSNICNTSCCVSATAAKVFQLGWMHC